RQRADAAAAIGDYEQAAKALREADGLWRGQALAGIRGDWIARMRDSLEGGRRAATVERVECELTLGRHADLVGELHGLVAQYPLDEALVAHQMTALYGIGRPAEALSLYSETRRRLVDEQGADPGPVLSGLHQRILQGDPALAVRRGWPRSGVPRLVQRPAATRARTTGKPVPATGAASRGREVMSAIELSYRALVPGDRRLLRLLSLTPCSDVSPHAAAAVGGGTVAETERALSSLLDQHLVTSAAGGRYRIVAREFAAARAGLEDSPLEQR